MANKENSSLEEDKEKNQFESRKGFKGKLKSLDKKSLYQKKLPWPERLIHKPRIEFKKPRAPNIPIPSRDVIFAAFLIVYAFLIAGFLYDITRNTLPLNYKQEDQTKQVIPVFFWTDLHEQYAIEGVVASIVIMMGTFGVIFLYQSTKNFYRPKSAYSYLALGIALIILSFVIVEYFIGQKGVKLYSSEL